MPLNPQLPHIQRSYAEIEKYLRRSFNNEYREELFMPTNRQKTRAPRSATEIRNDYRRTFTREYQKAVAYAISRRCAPKRMAEARRYHAAGLAILDKPRVTGSNIPSRSPT